MAKRRTKKDKIDARHDFTISWNPASSQIPVKSQKTFSEPVDVGKNNFAKGSVPMALDLSLASVKHDILKSLSVSVFIIAFELVIYFFWK